MFEDGDKCFLGVTLFFCEDFWVRLILSFDFSSYDGRNDFFMGRGGVLGSFLEYIYTVFLKLIVKRF